MTQPSTAEYQRHRTATLRVISRAFILKTARDLMKANQKNGHHYTRDEQQALSSSRYTEALRKGLS